MIPYSRILKQAYDILRAHKFLWALGLFLFWDMAANVASYHFNSDNNPFNDIKITGWMIFLAALLVFIFIQLTFRARAGIIAGTKSILEKKPMGFSKAFVTGGTYYRRLFAIWLFTIFMLMIL